MSGSQQVVAAAGESGALAKGAITIAFSSPYYGYYSGTVGSWVKFSGTDLVGIWYDSTGGAASSIQFDVALPGDPNSVLVIVGGNSTTMSRLSGSTYSAAGTSDPWGLTTRVGQTVGYLVYAA